MKLLICLIFSVTSAFASEKCFKVNSIVYHDDGTITVADTGWSNVFTVPEKTKSEQINRLNVAFIDARNTGKKVCVTTYSSVGDYKVEIR